MAKQHVVFKEPATARYLLADSRPAWIWLILRLWLGWGWLQAGIGKMGSPAWTGANAGAAVAGFAQGAVARMAGENPDVQWWYGRFLEAVVIPNAKVFGYMVAYGEVLVGLALILGLFTGIAAFFGTFMNLAFLLGGAVSSNPIYFVVGTWLVLAWRNSGWIGLDRWALPALGTPWQPGYLFDENPNPNPKSDEPNPA